MHTAGARPRMGMRPRKPDRPLDRRGGTRQRTRRRPAACTSRPGMADAPFGLLDRDPGRRGPFNLGTYTCAPDQRRPQHRAVTITSDPFPAFVQGDPAQIKQLNVTVDRPGFEFNPTSCSRNQHHGHPHRRRRRHSPVSSPFQVQDCADLPFHPSSPPPAAGTRANRTAPASRSRSPLRPRRREHRQSRPAIPGALPSRQSTLKKACPDAVFEANPAGCARNR